MTKTYRRLMLSGLGLLALGCPELVKDSGFQLWCGSALCDWELESGTMERVGTWHERDYGVSLRSRGTELSQHVDASASCLRFAVVADVDASAQVSLELDVLDDGTVEWDTPLPASDWRPLEFDVSMPATYDGVRVRFRKAGTGRAVLAQISVTSTGECHETPIRLRDLPLGQGCGSADECESGRCGEIPLLWRLNGNPANVCSECDSRADCAPNEICGYDTVTEGRACVAPTLHANDAFCVDDAECESGTCCDGICCDPSAIKPSAAD